MESEEKKRRIESIEYDPAQRPSEIPRRMFLIPRDTDVILTVGNSEYTTSPQTRDPFWAGMEMALKMVWVHRHPDVAKLEGYEIPASVD